MKHVFIWDLDLTEDDFKFEFVKLTEPTYPAYNGFDPFRPERNATVKINGNLIQFKTRLNFELLNILSYAHTLDIPKEINKLLLPEAIDFYINSKQYLRKKKLEKLNEVSKKKSIFWFLRIKNEKETI